ncbi:MupG family TIM beta-alpha barrel fold protein [Lactobacillus sp. ESL0701]|uniref:MupG family TIM beta-alpha barrel fold protein n=1 Tax=Lactobacillus sp. ESL0701 TaxID=2983217 RepID=UPI0023F7AE4C|nr:MupG family TIM beta-alpha barrel fold protein [Lactobacillus sp. ESL0701]MDF7672560.1 MupG family TIM beta-alpha barrel fold protein [Lactobacillus sp. ESL0701]
MIGFSIYLGEDLTAQDYNYLIAMRNAGFAVVFTSLHIPEDDAQVVLQRLNVLTKWCRNLDLDVIADVSKIGLARLGVMIEDVTQVKALNLTGLRIDDGVDFSIVAKLSKEMPLALNASTLSNQDIASLREHGADFDHLEAWHNYYPRPETGLDRAWLSKRNIWLHQNGLKTMAFVAGDHFKRGPIGAGLPTLEEQRDENPLAAMLELQKLGCDHVFIGDPSLKPSTITSFTNYLKHDAITLHVTEAPEKLIAQKWHNRPDVARDVIRLVEGRTRQLFNVEPQSKIAARPKGTITCDNRRYLRYQGELQVTKINLPADERVNVLGHVIVADLPLLAQVDANQAIIFEKVNQA